MTAPARVKPRRTWPQRLLILFNCCLIICSLSLAGVLGFAYQKAVELPWVELGSTLTPEPEGSAEPQNYLIVGTDSGEGLDPDDPILIGRPPGLRSDVIMVLRVEPGEEQASLLSLPRDLWVPIAGTRSSNRINSAIQGGPQRVIETVEDYFGIPINHYVELNFLGFRDLVAAIDGVPMYFPTPVRDRKTGLNITEPGCVTLDPVQALAFARSRAYEYYEDDRWHVDGTGDLGRISRQQDFLRRALHRAFAKGARNPLVLRSLIEAGLNAVKVDTLLTFDDLGALANRFRNFNPETLSMYSVPVVDDVVAGNAILRLVQDEAQSTLDIFRGQESSASLDSIVLMVQNGTGKPDEGKTVATDLRNAGLNVPPGNIGDAAQFDHERTTVLYQAPNAADAQLVARYLDPEPLLQEVPYVVGADVVVVSGADYRGVLTTPRATAPETSTTSTTLGSGGTSSTSSTSSSTTTTVIGVVPGPPPPDAHC